jgi:hypothetical protein
MFYLNFRYLVNTFQKNGHSLRDKLEKLNDLSQQKCLIPFHDVSEPDIQPEVGYTRHELGVILSTPRGCAFRYSRRYVYDGCSARIKGGYRIVLFIEFILHWWFTDGWSGWFCRPSSIDCNIGFRMRGPASVFTAELAAIRMAIENEALGRYLILTDSIWAR